MTRPSCGILIFTLGALLSCGVVTGCRAPAPQAKPRSPSFKEELAAYYPLAVGNTWSYAGTMLGIPTTQTVSILAKEAEGFRDSTGALLWLDAYGLRDSKRYLLRGPLEKGTSWMSVASVSAVERYVINATGVMVVAPAGRFEGCVTVRSSTRLTDRRTLVNDIIFAPYVGIVRIATVMVEDNTVRIPQVDLQLTSYRVTR